MRKHLCLSLVENMSLSPSFSGKSSDDLRNWKMSRIYSSKESFLRNFWLSNCMLLVQTFELKNRRRYAKAKWARVLGGDEESRRGDALWGEKREFIQIFHMIWNFWTIWYLLGSSCSAKLSHAHWECGHQELTCDLSVVRVVLVHSPKPRINTSSTGLRVYPDL